MPGSAITPADRLRRADRRSRSATRSTTTTGRARATKETLDDPLAKNVDQPGARFNTGHAAPDIRADAARVRDPEPTAGATRRSRASTTSTRPRSTAAGGRAVGASATPAPATPPCRCRAHDRSARSPSARARSASSARCCRSRATEYDHPLGLEPYAVTYTGYILFCNLVDCKYERKARPPLPNGRRRPARSDVGFGARLKTPLLASKKHAATAAGCRCGSARRASSGSSTCRSSTAGRAGARRGLQEAPPAAQAEHEEDQVQEGQDRPDLPAAHPRRRQERRHERVAATARIVFPYDDRGKRRRYSSAWTRVKSKRAWRGGYTQTSARGATLRFKTRAAAASTWSGARARTAAGLSSGARRRAARSSRSGRRGCATGASSRSSTARTNARCGSG